jgi:hypothetical protein
MPVRPHVSDTFGMGGGEISFLTLCMKLQLNSSSYDKNGAGPTGRSNSLQTSQLFGAVATDDLVPARSHSKWQPSRYRVLVVGAHTLRNAVVSLCNYEIRT